MSILWNPSGAVYVLSAPGAWVTSRPGETPETENYYWCGGFKWSRRVDDAALFQSEVAARAHADALNLRTWQITALSIR